MLSISKKNLLVISILITSIILGVSGIIRHQYILEILAQGNNNLRDDLLSANSKQQDLKQDVMKNYLAHKIETEIQRAALNSAFPSEFDQTSLLSELEILSLKYGINLDQITFSEEQSNEKYRILPLSFYLTGNRTSLLDFLDNLEHPEQLTSLPLINITDIILNQDENTEIVPLLSFGGDDEQARWKLELKAETYAQLH